MVWFSDVVEVPATTLDASTELFPDLSSKASSSRPTTSASTGSSQSLSPQSPSALLENTRLSVKRARKIFTPRQLIDVSVTIGVKVCNTIAIVCILCHPMKYNDQPTTAIPSVFWVVAFVIAIDVFVVGNVRTKCASHYGWIAEAQSIQLERSRGIFNV